MDTNIETKMETKIEEKVEEKNMGYDNYNEVLNKSMNETIKQNNYNEKKPNTVPEPFTAPVFLQYFSLNSSNDFTLGIPKQTQQNFSDNLTNSLKTLR